MLIMRHMPSRKEKSGKFTIKKKNVCVCACGCVYIHTETKVTEKLVFTKGCVT